MTMDKRRGVGLLTLLAVLGALIGLHHLWQWFLQSYVLPTRQAQWIWIADGNEETGPVAFYAVRDFDLDDPPTRATLTTTADEESLVFLNAVPIGGSHYANGRSLMLYNVEEALETGTNRLVVEVRSVRGIGGVLLRLEVEAGEGVSRVVTDGDWQIFKSSNEALFDRALPLPEGEAPKVWGAVPIGRWMASAKPKTIPTIAELRTMAGSVAAQRFRLPMGNRPWQDLGRTDRSSPGLGNWVTFDFGEEVMAYLALRFPAQIEEESRPIGLLYLGDRPRILDRSEAERHVVIMPGQRIWLDAKPRRFRYATYVGLTTVSGADAYLVDANRASEIWTAEHATTGAFGLPVGQLGPSLEDIVWRELHSLSSIADGE